MNKNEFLQRLKDEQWEIKESINDISKDFIFDYDINTNNENIDELINSFADANIDIYTSDVLEFIKDNYDIVKEACDEFGENSNDIIRMGQTGEFYQNYNMLYEDIENIIKCLAINYLIYNIEAINEEINDEKIDEFINDLEILDSGNNLEDIKELCDNFIGF